MKKLKPLPTKALLLDIPDIKAAPKQTALRGRAEKKLAANRKKKAISSIDARKLVHELQVHQIELEMQNEELRLAQTAIEESRARFSDLYDFAPVGYVTLDNNGIVLEANLTMSRLTGFDRGFLLNKPFHLFIAREDKDAFFAYFKRLIASDASMTLEAGLVKKDNSFFSAQFESIGFNATNKSDRYFFLAIFDVTKRKKMEYEIRRNEKRLGSLLKISTFKSESSRDLLDFALNEAIKLTESRIGYFYRYDDAKKEFTLNSWSNGVMNECSIAEKQTVYRLEKTGMWGEAVRQAKTIIINDFHAPHPLKKGYPEGHAALNKFLTVPIIIEGRIVGVVGVANKETDYNSNDALQLALLMDSAWKILERNRIQDLLRIQSEELAFANKELEAFGYSVSHDLSNPIHSIMRCLAIIARDSESILGKDSTMALGFITKSMEHMSRIISDLLALSKVTRLEVTREKTDLSDIALQIHAELKLSDPHRDIEFVVQPDCIAHADKGLMKIMLENLIDNAWKYTGPRKKALVEFGLQAGPHPATYFIRDNGVGFDMAHADKLFRPFQRLHSDKEFKGTGIGLSIVKRVLEKHGGTIWAESEKEKGATFLFRLE
jgi:PAS domain S-box-containing protein